MTSQTSNARNGWRRAVTGAMAAGALAAVLTVGFGSATAHADVLDDIAVEYMTGEGGGQVSKLIDDSLLLRAQGFRPSKSNITALTEALDRRPNQVPLIEALKSTLAFQRKLQAQQAAAIAPQGPLAGINTLPEQGTPPGGAVPGNQRDNQGGIVLGPGGVIINPQDG